MANGHHREDFIELLFPISIGVGFAEHIASILLHKNYTHTADHDLILPKLIQGSGYEIALLLVSMLAVVLSWNWYVPRIRTQPLDSIRFFLDICIVALYLVLLVSSWLYDVWFATLAIIWWFYVAWDVAFDKYCRDERLLSERAATKIAMGCVWAVVITLLAVFHHSFTFIGATFAFLSALAAVVLYRVDQVNDLSWLARASFVAIPLVFIFIGTRFGGPLPHQTNCPRSLSLASGRGLCESGRIGPRSSVPGVWHGAR